jgi:hypothetical protein
MKGNTFPDAEEIDPKASGKPSPEVANEAVADRPR